MYYWHKTVQSQVNKYNNELSIEEWKECKECK